MNARALSSPMVRVITQAANVLRGQAAARGGDIALGVERLVQQRDAARLNVRTAGDVRARGHGAEQAQPGEYHNTRHRAAAHARSVRP